MKEDRQRVPHSNRKMKSHILTIACSWLLLAFLLVPDSYAANYTITASAESGGSISPSGTVEVNSGDSQTFTITPNNNYYTVSVTVDGTVVATNQGSYTYVFNNVNANHTISATFAICTYQITTSAGTGGSISPASPYVTYGTSQTFTITPITGYSISGVTVDGVSQGAISTYTFNNVTTPHTISATFAANTSGYSITASAGANGTITPSGTVLVPGGTNGSFTITPNNNYYTVSVTVDGTVVATNLGSYTYVFNSVNANHTISATFAICTYQITTSAGTGGSISPSSPYVTYGSSQTFTITPVTGYSISSVTVDGVSVGAVSTYTFSNVTATHTISATFAVNTSGYSITASAGANGTITPSGTVLVTGGSNGSFTITPNNNYYTVSVTIDGAVVATNLGSYTYVFNNVSANHTISATFAICTYQITTSAGTGGSISPSSPYVTYGSSQTFTITPNAGYTISDVTVDGVSQGVITSGTFDSVNATHTIAATFAINSSSITVTIDSPTNNATFYRPDVMVTGTVTNTGGYETGVTVNGVIANVYGNNFVANHVPLMSGTNTITATAIDTNGGTSSATTTVNAVFSGYYISLTADTSSGVAALVTTLRIDGSFSIGNSSISVTGPGQPVFLSSSADTYQVQMTPEGIYYFTASVTGPDANTYQDTIAVVAMNATALDNLLRGKWNAMVTSLGNEDITTAITYLSPDTRAIYQQMYTAIIDQLPAMVATQTGFNFISVNNNTAFYDLITLENGTAYSYEVVFVKGLNGLWTIHDF